MPDAWLMLQGAYLRPHEADAKAQLEAQGFRVRCRTSQLVEGERPPEGPIYAPDPRARARCQAAGLDVTPLDEPDVEQYAKGGGWYDVPGADKSLRREDAIKHLRGT